MRRRWARVSVVGGGEGRGRARVRVRLLVPGGREGGREGGVEPRVLLLCWLPWVSAGNKGVVAVFGGASVPEGRVVRPAGASAPEWARGVAKTAGVPSMDMGRGGRGCGASGRGAGRCRRRVRREYGGGGGDGMGGGRRPFLEGGGSLLPSRLGGRASEALTTGGAVWLASLSWERGLLLSGSLGPSPQGRGLLWQSRLAVLSDEERSSE